MRLKLALAMLLALGASASGQPDDPGMRARVRDRVRVAIEQKLIAVLGLDPATAARFTQVTDRYDAQIAELQRENGLNHRELKQLLDGGGNDPATINRLVDKILDTRARVQRLELDRSRDVRAALSPAQYGRMILVYPQVQKEITQELWKALAEKRAQKRGGAPGPVEVPQDWQ
jgi:hypothetical protein